VTTRRISSGSEFEERYCYSRAVVSDGWVLVSGTTGMDYATMTLAEGAEAQCRQTLRNIAAALAQAGATLDDVVRVRYILSDAGDFPACAPALREAFAMARPAATMLTAGLIDPAMKIEIEVTARLPAEALDLGAAGA
jgi:enamine deaminase RidA (YjgF/YER057c/UK114 family)